MIEFTSRANAKILDETDKWKLVQVLRDIPMYVMKGDESVAPHLEHDGFWESWITKWVLDHSGPGTVFWDIGANTGYYSLAAMSKGAMAIAFEPNPEYYEMMRATAEYHDSGFFFKIINKALSDTDGVETLYLPKNLHGSASLTEMHERWEVTPVQVETTTLSSYGVGAGRHIIKIDAEGAEEKIWRGAGDFFNKGFGTKILMEYTPGAYSDSFLDELEDWSGGLKWINFDGQAEPIDKQRVRDQGDWIMLLLEQK